MYPLHLMHLIKCDELKDTVGKESFSCMGWITIERGIEGNIKELVGGFWIVMDI